MYQNSSPLAWAIVVGSSLPGDNASKNFADRYYEMGLKIMRPEETQSAT